MKRLLLLPSLFLATFTALAVPNSDPFADATSTGGTSYDVGSNLVGQRNSTLVGPWYARGTNFGTTQPVIAAGNLAYSRLPSSTGNSVSFSPANAMSACIDLSLASGQPETVYYSFLLKITDVSTVPTFATNNPFAAFLDDPSLAFTPNQIGRLGSRLLTKRVGDGYVLGTSKSANAADFAYEPDASAHNVNDVLFVVASYQRVAGVQTNVQMWVNPPASSFGSNQPPAATVIATAGNTALNTGGARGFTILCQFLAAPSGIIDDVRVSTNWAGVTTGDPAITTQPASQTFPEGSTANFTVTATGTAPLSYQWIKDGTTPLVDGGNISGANTATLTLSNVSAADLGSYSVYVTNGIGAFLESASATLSLSDPVVSAPQSRTNNFGTTATFTVTASGTAPFSYQWFKQGVGALSDGGNISGSQTTTLTLTSVSFPDGGSYFVRVNNSVGTVDSADAILTVRDPYVVTQPASVSSGAGSNVTFSVVADGTGQPFTYQWRKNGSLIFDGGTYSGTSTSTLTLSGISAADEGSYSVMVIGTYDTAISSNAILSVISPVSITAQPLSRTVIAGSKAVFAVGASGTAPISYQWQRNGSAISDATISAYTVTNAQASDQGSYSVVVTGPVNAVTSSVAVLTITANVQLANTNLVVIRVGDGAQTLSLNGNSMFLDQFTPAGEYVSSVGIPDEGTNATITLGWNHVNQTSGSVTGSGLTRSLDGRYMVVAGYNASYPYGTNLNNTTAAAVPRGIGLVDSQGQYTLAVSSQATYNNTYWRTAVSDGTNNYWGAAGANGTYYFGFDAPAATVQTQFANVRGMGLFNGSIYLASAVSGNNGIIKLDGMPNAATTPTLLFAGSTGTTDMEVSPDGNLIYVADDRTSGNGGVQRWEFNGSAWNLAYTLTNGVGDSGPRYVTADFSGANPVVYTVTKENDNNRIVRFDDTGAGTAGTTVAWSGANQIFRGIRFGPTAAAVPPTVSVSRNGNNVVITWSGAFTLQSSVNVAGPYSNVSGASSPYTVNVNAAAQTFFRLAQ